MKLSKLLKESLNRMYEGVANPKPLDLKKLVGSYKSAFSAYKPKVINKPTLQGIEVDVPHLSKIELLFHLTLEGVLTHFTVSYDKVLTGGELPRWIKPDPSYEKIGAILQEILQTWSNTYGSTWDFEQGSSASSTGVYQTYTRKLTKEELANLPAKGTAAEQKLYTDQSDKYTTHPEIGVGTIFYGTWGYSMSLVDWYVVTGRTNATVTLAPIEGVKMDDQVGKGKVMPSKSLKKIRTSSEIKNSKIQDYQGKACIRGKNTNLYIWDGKAKYYDTWD